MRGACKIDGLKLTPSLAEDRVARITSRRLNIDASPLNARQVLATYSMRIPMIDA